MLIGMCAVWYFWEGSSLPTEADSGLVNVARTIVESSAASGPSSKQFVRTGPGAPTIQNFASGARQGEVEVKSFSFGGHKDIWAFAAGALNSSSSAYIFEARAAAAECVGFQRLMPELLAFGAGSATSIFGAEVSPARQLAVQAVVERCHGFARAGSVTQSKLIRELDERAEQLQSPELFAGRRKKTGPLTMSDLGVLLFSDSAAARDLALSGLVSLWSKRNGVAELNDRRIEMAGVAAVLVMCDLGKDCSLNSYHTLLRCALSEPCGSQSLWADWASGFSAAEVEQILRHRSTMANAIKMKRLEILGDK